MLVAHADTLTQLEPWLIVAGGLMGVAWLTRKGNTGDAVDYLQKANGVLHEQNEKLTKDNAELIVENAALHTKTDFAAAFDPLKDQIANHERRADERAQKTLAILDMIAKRLGRESDADYEARNGE